MLCGILLKLWCSLLFLNASTGLKKINRDEPPHAPPWSQKAACPKSMRLIEGSCYKVVTSPQTWSQAKANCEQEGLQLARLDSDVDMAWRFRKILMDTNPDRLPGKNLWVGALLGRERSFIWWDNNARVVSGVRNGVGVGHDPGVSACVQLVTDKVELQHHPLRSTACAHDRLSLCQESRIKKKEIFNVEYQTSESNILTDILSSEEAILNNNSENPQTTTVTMDFSYEESTDWVSSKDGKPNAETVIKTGIPFLLKGEIKFGGQASYTSTSGESDNKSKKNEVSATVLVPSKAQMTIWVTYSKKYIDIPYSADEKIYYDDGTSRRDSHTGVFKSVSGAGFTILYVQISIQQDRPTVTTGDVLTLTCNVAGSSNGFVATWSRQGHDRLANNVRQLGNDFVFNNISPENAGIYICSVTTPQGVFERAHTVTIQS